MPGNGAPEMDGAVLGYPVLGGYVSSFVSWGAGNRDVSRRTTPTAGTGRGQKTGAPCFGWKWGRKVCVGGLPRAQCQSVLCLGVLLLPVFEGQEPALGHCLSEKTKPAASIPFCYSQVVSFLTSPELGTPQQHQAGPASMCSTPQLPPRVLPVGGLCPHSSLLPLSSVQMGCKGGQPPSCPHGPWPQTVWAPRGSLGLLIWSLLLDSPGQIPPRSVMSTELGPTPAFPCDTRLRQAGWVCKTSQLSPHRAAVLCSLPSAPGPLHYISVLQTNSRCTGPLRYLACTACPRATLPLGRCAVTSPARSLFLLPDSGHSCHA